MVVFPNCKINLGLYITQKRPDGFHNLETVFYPVGLKDALEIIPAHHAEKEITFSSSGLIVDGKVEDNICIKAYQLLKKDYPQLPSIKMHLHKAIPMGAGLGGGSADGAFALKLQNEKFQLGLSTQQLIDYALQLGSDCPFFIVNKPCFATSRGEILETVELDLLAYHFAIVNPGIHVNTGWAFAQLQLNNSNRPDLKEIIQQPISTWKDQLINDFEEPVCKAHPEIANIKQQLYNAGAVYASMTGSGSTVFGIFDAAKTFSLNLSETYFTKVI